jgi:hypothetical protein
VVFFVGCAAESVVEGRLRPSRASDGAVYRLLLGRFLGHQPRQSDQVVGGAAEDEQQVDLEQTSQLDLAQWTGLLQPTVGRPDPAYSASNSALNDRRTSSVIFRTVRNGCSAGTRCSNDT